MVPSFVSSTSHRPFFPFSHTCPNHKDTLLLAGDVTQNFARLRETLQHLAETFGRVCFVPGNHDLYVTAQVLQSHICTCRCVFAFSFSLPCRTCAPLNCRLLTLGIVAAPVLHKTVVF